MRKSKFGDSQVSQTPLVRGDTLFNKTKHLEHGTKISVVAQRLRLWRLVVVPESNTLYHKTLFPLLCTGNFTSEDNAEPNEKNGFEFPHLNSCTFISSLWLKLRKVSSSTMPNWQPCDQSVEILQLPAFKCTT